MLNPLLSSVRAKGKITLAVASTRIAATLLSKAQTAHSRFKIPIKLDQSSKCNINLNSPLARLTREAELIIGDEVVMQNRMEIECVDRTLKVVLNNKELFCGKTVVLAGDFRQILPVGRQDGRCKGTP